MKKSKTSKKGKAKKSEKKQQQQQQQQQQVRPPDQRKPPQALIGPLARSSLPPRRPMPQDAQMQLAFQVSRRQHAQRQMQQHFHQDIKKALQFSLAEQRRRLQQIKRKEKEAEQKAKLEKQKIEAQKKKVAQQ